MSWSLRLAGVKEFAAEAWAAEGPFGEYSLMNRCQRPNAGPFFCFEWYFIHPAEAPGAENALQTVVYERKGASV